MKKQKILLLFIAFLTACEAESTDVAKKKVEMPKPSTSITVSSSAVSTTAQVKPAIIPVALVTTPTPKPLDSKRLPVNFGNEKKTKICEGKLNKPQGIDVKSGKVYVTTVNEKLTAGHATGEIKVFDIEGYPNLTIAISNPFMIPLPTDLIGVVSNGFNLWTLNKTPSPKSKSNLYSFDTAGNSYKEYIVGQSSSEFSSMALYSSIATPILYLADTKNKSITKVSFNQTIIAEQKADFVKDINIKGIVTDSLGNLLVCSGADNNYIITSYDKDAKEVLSFSLVGKNNTGFTSVASVAGIAYDTKNGGTIYALVKLSNELASIILRFDSKGNFLGYFGEDAIMTNPTSIVVDKDGYIYALDTAKSLIYRFTPAKAS